MFKPSKKILTVGLLSIGLIFLSTFLFLNFPRTHPSNTRLFKNVLTVVNDNYVDRSRIKLNNLLLGVTENLSNSLADVYVTDFSEDTVKTVLTLHVGNDQMQITMKMSDKESVFIEVLDQIDLFVREHTIEDDRIKDIQNIIINGFLKELDPHSNFFNSQVFEKFSKDSKGSFGGIGIFIDSQSGNLIVVSPIADTPAEKIGLKAKDLIKKIDGISAVAMSLEEAVSLIKGEIGTFVTLSIMREGWADERDFVIQRDKIYNSMDSHVFKNQNKNIGYIRFRRFTNESTITLEQNLNKMKAYSSDFTGLILDLRNNPGGYLEEAIKISDLFLERGIIVATGKTKKEIDRIYKAGKGVDYTNFPIFLLVNQNSASASEILAAALMKNKRAVLVGNTTYGKGSVQTIYDFKEGTALKLTVSQYFTAGLDSIQSIGVTPQILFNAIRPDPENFKFLHNKIQSGEKFLENAFQWGQDGPNILGSLYVLNYINDAAPQKDDVNDDVYVNGINMTQLEKDSMFNLAKDTLESLDSSLEVTDILEPALKKAKEQNDKNMAQFAKRLKKEGITWSENVSTHAGQLQNNKIKIELKKVVNGREIPFSSSKDVLANNEDMVLYFTVTNQNNKKLQNIIGLVQSSDNRLNNIQLVFGEIGTNEKVTKKYIMKSLNRENGTVIPFRFSLYSNYDDLNSRANSFFKTGGGYDPDYVLTVNANKTDSSFDGQLNLSIKNNSKKYTGKPVLILQSTYRSGINFNHTQFVGGTLNPGDVTSDLVSFKYSVPLNKTQTEEDKQIKFQLLDTQYNRTIFEQTYNFESPYNITLKNQPARIKVNKITPITDKEKFVLSGTVSDDKKVKDYFVMLNNRKVFYQSVDSQKANEPVPFNINLVLQKNKLNNIRIFVRDSENVYSAKELQVWSGEVMYQPEI